MTPEEKELLIRDLCSRLPYNCMISIAEGGIDGIKWADVTLNSYLFHQIMEEDAWEYVKPYLRPLSSMTKSERKEFDDLSKFDEDVWMGNHKVGFPKNVRIMSKCVDWLNRKMFDHRGLIPKGLALEVNDGI